MCTCEGFLITTIHKTHSTYQIKVGVYLPSELGAEILGFVSAFSYLLTSLCHSLFLLINMCMQSNYILFLP